MGFQKLHVINPRLCPCGNRLNAYQKKYCSIDCRLKYGKEEG